MSGDLTSKNTSFPTIFRSDIAIGDASGTWDLDTASAVQVLGQVSGGKLVKTGDGTLSLFVGNTHNSTSVRGGTLEIATGSGLGNPDAVLELDGGTLRILDFVSVGMERRLTLGDAHGTLDTNGFAATLEGVVTGGGSLVKTGNGTLTLLGTNTHSGTIIQGGTLTVPGNDQLGAADAGIELFDNAKLQVTQSATIPRPLTLGSGGGTIEVDATASLVWQGSISGEEPLVKTGGGVLTLGGNNGHLGTVVREGTLRIGAAAQLGNSSSRTEVGGRLEFTDSLHSGSLQELAIPDSGGEVHVAADDAVVWRGPLTGQGGLLKTGEGTFELVGSHAAPFNREMNVVREGTLNLNRSPGVPAIGGYLLVTGGTVNLLASEQLYGVHTLLAGGTLNMSGVTEGIQTFNLSDGSTLNLNSAA